MQRALGTPPRSPIGQRLRELRDFVREFHLKTEQKSSANLGRLPRLVEEPWPVRTAAPPPAICLETVLLSASALATAVATSTAATAIAATATAIAATATTAVAATPITAAASTTRRTRFAGSSFIHGQRSSFNGLTVEFRYRLLRICLGRHRNKGKAARFPGKLILHQCDLLYWSCLSEKILQIRFGRVEGKIPYV